MQDPRGWTYHGVPSDECDDANVIQPLFPKLDFWSCQPLDQCAKDYKSNSSLPISLVIHPNIALQAALLLTATSTSTEAEETTPPSMPETTTDRVASAPQTISFPEKTSASRPMQSLSPPALPEQDTPAAPAQPAKGGNAPDQNPPVAPQANGQSQNQESVPQGKSKVVDGQNPPPEDTLGQVKYVPLVATSTNPEGVVVESTTFAVVTPIYSTSTNEEGEVGIATGFSTLAISASVPTIIASTNAQGDAISSTSYLPAIVLTTTNAEGSRITTTSILATPSISPTVTSPPAITVSGRIVTANPLGQYLFDGQTLTPGGVVTASGIRISLSPDEASVSIGPSVQNPATIAPPAFTIGGQTVRANSMNQYIVNGQTLTPGGVISISGTRVSLSPDEASLVVGTSVENLATTTPPPLTIDGQTITANPQSQYVIDGQTLTPGGVVTVSGTRISLSPDETAVVVGTSMQDLGKSSAVQTESGSGKAPGTTTSNSSAANLHRECWLEALVFLIGSGMVIWL